MDIESGVGDAGWRVHTCPVAISTNDLARDLPAWSAIRAEVQTGGRGRFGRLFVSDAGGLWISAVLPATGGARRWVGFSLMVGCHLARMLKTLGVPEARLRWPNDLMAGRKKLGGLLIEQLSSDSLIVGFGLNVTNSPWLLDPELEPISTSLSHVLARVPDLQTLTVRTLDALAAAHERMLEGGMSLAIENLNREWSIPMPVEIILSRDTSLHGRFTGLDMQGHLRLLDASGAEFFVEHHRIEKLIELD